MTSIQTPAALSPLRQRQEFQGALVGLHASDRQELQSRCIGVNAASCHARPATQAQRRAISGLASRVPSEEARDAVMQKPRHSSSTGGDPERFTEDGLWAEAGLEQNKTGEVELGARTAAKIRSNDWVCSCPSVSPRRAFTWLADEPPQQPTASSAPPLRSRSGRVAVICDAGYPWALRGHQAALPIQVFQGSVTVRHVLGMQ
ncbi:hypothetical protein B0H63DRAFT_108516 [Podospora didyma]|uniref:Uncharacterized protein n=1 Tax=Podospora didyma TaxID=330526 RepID=A0AAE0NYL8_9PEZI|nr:hypothetical protein B0H63DRAFT_108516 [Podospora didyma]